MASARGKKMTKKAAPKKAAPKKTAPKKKIVAKAARKPAPKKVVAKKKVAPKKAAPKKAAPKNKAAPVATKPPPALQAKIHRALEAAEVTGLISRLPSPMQTIVRSLREVVLGAAPEAKELLDGNSPAYSANGIFARIEPSERAVLIRFLRGSELPSANKLQDQSLTLESVDGLKASVLKKLVREAVLLNLKGPAEQRAEA